MEQIPLVIFVLILMSVIIIDYFIIFIGYNVPTELSLAAQRSLLMQITTHMMLITILLIILSRKVIVVTGIRKNDNGDK